MSLSRHRPFQFNVQALTTIEWHPNETHPHKDR
jgi:hypothetical protein